MRTAVPGDKAKLVELMAEFYAEAGFELNRDHAGQAFASLLADKTLGHVWLIEVDRKEVSYLVLTFAFSMEYGGRSGVLEDLFVHASFRGSGLGRAALVELRAFCVRQGLRAVTVEVGRDNSAAHSVYRAAGFVASDRQLLTLELAPPAHVA